MLPLGFMPPPGLVEPPGGFRAPPGLMMPGGQAPPGLAPTVPPLPVLGKFGPSSSAFSEGSTVCPDEAAAEELDSSSSLGQSTPRDLVLRDVVPEQTVVIFDWDDTLCPTTAAVQLSGGDLQNIQDLPYVPPEEFCPVLPFVASEALALIQHAQGLGCKVVIVTNAGKGWVEWSCARWMPELLPALDGVEVISARSNWEPLGFESPTSWKENAFRVVIDDFYSQYPDRLYENILCVGDAPYEHDALERVIAAGRNSDSDQVKCMKKSVKFDPLPSAERLLFELTTLRFTLTQVVGCTGSMFINYEELP